MCELIHLIVLGAKNESCRMLSCRVAYYYLIYNFFVETLEPFLVFLFFRIGFRDQGVHFYTRIRNARSSLIAICDNKNTHRSEKCCHLVFSFLNKLRFIINFKCKVYHKNLSVKLIESIEYKRQKASVMCPYNSLLGENELNTWVKISKICLKHQIIVKGAKYHSSANKNFISVYF